MTTLTDRLRKAAGILDKELCAIESHIESMEAEITHLTSELKKIGEFLGDVGDERDTLQWKADALSDAMQEIKQWADAYPKDVFPAPNLKLADRVLKDAGISMTGMNGTFARRLMKGVGKIADAALTAFKEGK